MEAIEEFTDSGVEAWDTAKGVDIGGLVMENLELFWLRLTTGWFWGMHVAPPGATFSRTSQPPLKSSEYPWGLPDCTELHQAKIYEWNALALIAVEVIKICLRLGSGLTIEDPRISMI